jgi:hypothetical protein
MQFIQSMERNPTSNIFYIHRDVTESLMWEECIATIFIALKLTFDCTPSLQRSRVTWQATWRQNISALYCTLWVLKLLKQLRVGTKFLSPLVVAVDFQGSEEQWLENAFNETNLMHYLSLVYSVTIPVHVSGVLVAHHQELTMNICNNWYLLYVLVDCQLAWLGWSFHG